MTLDSRFLTMVFWVTVALYAVSFWLTPFPPCIDYPQHLALGAIMGRMLGGHSGEGNIYVYDPWTYNGLFHELVALLSQIMRPEWAGKVLLSSLPIILGISMLALLRVLGRPLWLAFFVLPFAYGYVVGWGFVNYVLASAMGVGAMALFIRWTRQPSGRVGIGLAILCLLIAHTHVLAFLCTIISFTIAELVRTKPRLLETSRAALPLFPAGFFVWMVFRHHTAAPNIYWEPQNDGIDEPAWRKAGSLIHYSVGNFVDHSDEYLFGAMAASMMLLVVIRYMRGGRPGDAGAVPLLAPVLAGSWLVFYLVVPRVLASTWFVFERLPFWFFTFAAAACPVALRERSRRWFAGGISALALSGGASTAWHLAHIPDTSDASDIIDAIPENRHVIAVIHEHDGAPVVFREIWVHLAAYYQVRRPGEIAFSFTRYASLPLRHRDGTVPTPVPPGFEWSPKSFDPAASFVSDFDTVLVRSPDADVAIDPSTRIFGQHADDVTVMAHRGRFWLYDISRLGKSSALP